MLMHGLSVALLLTNGTLALMEGMNWGSLGIAVIVSQ
jgi:hypothetical protein